MIIKVDNREQELLKQIQNLVLFIQNVRVELQSQRDHEKYRL